MEHIIQAPVLQFLKDFFKSIWYIFESIPVPFLDDFTVADLTIGLLGFSAFVVIIKKMIDSGGAVGFRSGEGKRIANQAIFGHKQYYGGDSENNLPHGEV